MEKKHIIIFIIYRKEMVSNLYWKIFIHNIVLNKNDKKVSNKIPFRWNLSILFL